MERCELCGGPEIRHRPAKQGVFAECATCRSARFTPDHPTAAEELYTQSYRQREHGERFPKIIERTLCIFRNERARWCLAGLNPGRALDIGCGRGDMLISLATRGWQGEGLEVHGDFSHLRSINGVKVHLGEFETVELEGSFDLILMFHVLEHLANFSLVMDKVARLIKPAGRLVIEVPNAASLFHRMFGPAWFGCDLPYHRYHFTPRGLRSAMEARGWSLLRLKQWSLEFGPYSMGQTLANAAMPRWHNALYNTLQAPRLQTATMLKAIAQLPLVAFGAVAYPLLHVIAAFLQRSEIIRMSFQKR